MDHPTSCWRALGAADAYSDNCDLLVGLDGYDVIGVARGPDGLVVRVESPPGPVGCPDCGVRERRQDDDSEIHGWIRAQATSPNLMSTLSKDVSLRIARHTAA